jgi:hypothetical protein
MRSHGDVSDVPTLVAQNDQHEQESIRDGGHDEEIDSRDLVDAIGEERPLGLGWRALATRHGLRDRGLGMHTSALNASGDSEAHAFALRTQCRRSSSLDPAPRPRCCLIE